MNNCELKKLAMNARNRLINSKVSDAGIKKMSAPLSPNVKFKIIESHDESFARRAREVLEKDILNPIRELMDEDRYKSLDSTGREKYLLDTIEKFLSYKKLFDRECKSVL